MKTDAFEDDLRQALAQRAAEVPGEAVDRLRNRNYRPRSRNWFLVAGAGVVTAVAVSAAVAATALLPAGHQPSHRAHAQLAAWTVVKQANGTVLVKIREFRDPAGLQRRLRADGVPASIAFIPANLAGKGASAIVHFKGNPCREYNGGEGQAQNVVTGGSPFTVGMFIHPSAIPSGAGVQFVVGRNAVYNSPGESGGGMWEWLVQPSPQCTGS
jgi:hypothetical protein